MKEKHYYISSEEIQKINYHVHKLLRSLEADRDVYELSMKELLTLNIIKNTLGQVFTPLDVSSRSLRANK